MAKEHWFDTFNKAGLRAVSRRAIGRSLAAMLPGLLLDSRADSSLGKGKKDDQGNSSRKGRGKGNGKGNGKGKKDEPKSRPSCSGGACGAEPEWGGNQGEINHCEFICEQCKEPGNGPFCIRDGTKPDGTPTMVADCCEEAETCCDAACCPAGRACCRGDHGETCCQRGQTCCGGKCCPVGQTCCGGKCCPTNEPDMACCDGVCVFTYDHLNHCGACNNPCPPDDENTYWYCEKAQCVCRPRGSLGRSVEGSSTCEGCPAGQTRCGDRCVDTGSDPEHCSGCGNVCGAGQVCRNQQCTCPTTCPQGKNCIHGDGSLCVESPTRPDCHCGCPPGYEYCQHREGHWVCVSDCSLVT